jgi:hypothetical protein
VISGSLDGLAVHASHLAPVVLLLLHQLIIRYRYTTFLVFLKSY